MLEVDEELKEIIRLREEISSEQKGAGYLTSENPKLAELIQKASDYCLKKNAGIYQKLAKYNKNYKGE